MNAEPRDESVRGSHSAAAPLVRVSSLDLGLGAGDSRASN